MMYQAKRREAEARNAKIEILAGWAVYMFILVGLGADALAKGFF